MREVKFKLWHKGLKKFFTTYYSDQISMMPDGNIFWMGECETDNFTLLQYTGLKDIIGKDIFEGGFVAVSKWHNCRNSVFRRFSGVCSGLCTRWQYGDGLFGQRNCK